MNLREFKALFKNKLDNLYDHKEVNSLFRMLITHHLEWDLTQQILREMDEITAEKTSILLDDTEALAKAKPIQQIIGKAWFMDLPFWVNQHVLIPRPETEELVHWIVNHEKESNLMVSDICSGSGCIAISLAKYLKTPTVYAYEFSTEALQVAKHNNLSLLPQTQINWVEKDVLTGSFVGGQEDIFVSNPPYIPMDEAAKMADNVLQYEPHLALFTPNNDALLFYRCIAEQVRDKGKIGARLYFECHETYAQAVADLLEKTGYNQVEVIRDMQKKPRMIRAVLG